MKQILYVQLSENVLTSGSTFDALTHGTFVDMYGRKTTFREKDLEKYVENTIAAIEATKAKDGEIVGLPIDVVDHNHGDGAGWITGVELDKDRGVIKVKPNWTTIGVDVISQKIRRFFSATIDVTNKVFLGGTLTNWPAVRNKDGRILLEPVSLSHKPGISDDEIPQTELLELSDDASFDEKQRRARVAFYDEYGSGDIESDPWVREVFEKYLVAYYEGKDWRVEFSINKDGEYSFKEEEKWTEVRQTWIDAMLDPVKALKDIIGTFTKPANSPENISTEDNTMTLEITKEELKTLVADLVDGSMGEAVKTEFASLREAMIEAVNPPASEEENIEGDETPDILDRFDLTGEKDKVEAEIKQELVDQFDALRAQVRSQSTLQISKIRRETHLNEFAVRVTTGNEDVPYGIPVDTMELKTWLVGLKPEQAEFAKSVLESVWKSGRTEFTELGHSKDIEGTKDLPQDILDQLRKKELTLEDLRDPIMQPVIGNLSQYNLSEFKEG